jgi:hypothetical protein
MARVLAIIGICLVFGILYLYSRDGSGNEDGAALDVKYRYLVVYTEGPPDWMKKHSFSIQWQGKEVNLPVVFRVPGSAIDFEMQSGGEIFGHLNIGKEEVPVKAEPDTKFQVRNTGVIAFIREKSSQSGAVGLSIATSVAMSPPEHPGELNPNFIEKEWEPLGKKLEKRLKILIAAGRLIDISP